MMLNADSGAPQATYSLPFCRLFQRSKEIAAAFGQHLPRSCARRQAQMRHGSDMTHFYSLFPSAQFYGDGFETPSGERRLMSAIGG
jgi:hypothetical protein